MKLRTIAITAVNRTWKRVAWETVMVVVCSIAAYEIIGLDPRFPEWHTISFEAYLHSWVAWLVAIVVAALAIGFEIWWYHHARSPHEKLYYRRKETLYLSKKMIKQLEELRKKK